LPLIPTLPQTSYFLIIKKGRAMLIVTGNSIKINEEMFVKDSNMAQYTNIAERRESTLMSFSDYSAVLLFLSNMFLYAGIVEAKYNIKHVLSYRVWWCMPVILALRRLRQED
jgi:hypothetical protein